MDPKIVFQDKAVTLIDKPPGLLVHAQKGFHRAPTLVGWLKEHMDPQPMPVHRLDRPTSGILLASTDREVLSRLSRDFREGLVEKTYLAIVRGWAEDSGRIDIPLAKKDSDTLQEAETLFCCLERREYPWPNPLFPTTRYSLVELKPKTGRYHQLRRHMARHSHPILGDTSHGDLRHNRIYRDSTGVDRLLLHAWKIRFIHPESGEWMEFTAPIPKELTLPSLPIN